MFQQFNKYIICGKGILWPVWSHRVWILSECLLCDHPLSTLSPPDNQLRASAKFHGDMTMAFLWAGGVAGFPQSIFSDPPTTGTAFAKVGSAEHFGRIIRQIARDTRRVLFKLGSGKQREFKAKFPSTNGLHPVRHCGVSQPNGGTDTQLPLVRLISFLSLYHL